MGSTQSTITQPYFPSLKRAYAYLNLLVIKSQISCLKINAKANSISDVDAREERITFEPDLMRGGTAEETDSTNGAVLEITSLFTLFRMSLLTIKPCLTFEYGHGNNHGLWSTCIFISKPSSGQVLVH